MKKVFIWNTEYDVLLAIADKNEKEYEEIDGKWKEYYGHKENYQEYFDKYHRPYAESRKIVVDKDEGYKHLIDNPPDFIFDTNKSMGYPFYHGNA